MNQRTTIHYLCLGCLALLGLGAFAASGASGAAADDKDHPQVVLETNKGNITLELDRTKAPITVDNFLKYVDSGHYNGTVFHRVIKTFMIQGGGFSAPTAASPMKEKATNPPIKNESGNGLSNVKGTIAMARTNDPDSASAQFFINLFDKNRFLDTGGGGYAVFGKVIDGMDVVDKIAAVPTGDKPAETPQGRTVFQDVPDEPVVIKTAKRVKKS